MPNSSKVISLVQDVAMGAEEECVLIIGYTEYVYNLSPILFRDVRLP